MFNSSLISSAIEETLAEARLQPEVWGRLVESAVGAHLLNSAVSAGFSICYWRNGKHEVDFVLERKSKIVGLEVKSARMRRPSGMAKFKEQYPAAKVYLAGADGIALEQFLLADPGELF